MENATDAANYWYNYSDIYNHLTTHTRDSFEANYDDTDRKMLRTYVSSWWSA